MKIVCTCVAFKIMPALIDRLFFGEKSSLDVFSWPPSFLIWLNWTEHNDRYHIVTLLLQVSGDRRGQHRPSQLPNPLASLLPPGCWSWCGAERKRHNVGNFLTRLISSCPVLDLLECSPYFIHSALFSTIYDWVSWSKSGSSLCILFGLHGWLICIPIVFL